VYVTVCVTFTLHCNYHGFKVSLRLQYKRRGGGEGNRIAFL